MQDALLYQLRTGTDKAMRDAVLLEDGESLPNLNFTYLSFKLDHLLTLH
jgi:hypothetical protein